MPYVGAVSSSVPGLLVGLSQSPHHFFLALGVYVGVHVIEGYVVQPYVMRRAVEANPALLLFFQALMGALFGLLGLMVAMPLLTVLQITVTTLWIERRLHKKPPTEESPPEERPPRRHARTGDALSRTGQARRAAWVPRHRAAARLPARTRAGGRLRPAARGTGGRSSARRGSSRTSPRGGPAPLRPGTAPRWSSRE